MPVERRVYDETIDRLAAEWVRLAWWLPMTWSEYVSLPSGERHAIFKALRDFQKETGVGSFSGQSRQDRRQGLV